MLPDAFAATIELAQWFTDFPKATFKLLYNSTQPGYHLVSSGSNAEIEMWQAESLSAVSSHGVCSVVPGSWQGWFDWLTNQDVHYLGLEECPGYQGTDRLCDTFTPSGALFDKVRLWTEAHGDTALPTIPVAMRWPTSMDFAVPFGAFVHQTVQSAGIGPRVMIFRSFDPIPPHSQVPFPDEKRCSRLPVERSHFRCSPAPAPSQIAPLPRDSTRVLKFFVAHNLDMLVPDSGGGKSLLLENVNVADLRGESLFYSFYVTQPRLKALGNLNLMSVVEVEVDTRWGLYQGCNYGVCEREMWILPSTAIDPDFSAVGRLAIPGLHALLTQDEVYNAQCGEGALGTWFHFPKTGKCRQGREHSAPPPSPLPAPLHSTDTSIAVRDDVACTWRQLRVVKTVDAHTCFLANAPLVKALHTWATFWVPFCAITKVCTPTPTAMEKAILAAFESDDPARGGCAAVVN